MATKTAELKVRLAPEVLAEVVSLAAEMGATKSAVIRAGVKALREQREHDAALDALIDIARADSKRLRGRRPPKGRFALK